MKKIIGFICSIFILFGLKNANAQENSLLWRVSGKNLKTPSYLFGTVHLICQEDYHFSEAMVSALESTNQLVLEVNLYDPESQAAFSKGIMLPEGSSLKDMLNSEADYLHLEKALQQKGLDINEYNSLRPIVLLSLMSMKSFGCDNTVSYESKLMEQVNARSLKTIGLETAEFQLNLFNGLSKQEISEMLIAAADDVNNNERVNRMVELYKAQNIKGLHEFIVESPEMKANIEKFLYQRNKNWAKALPKIMESNNSFIAVGAGHLAGKEGLIELLIKAGYKVEAVR